jgi:hypothetical protein
MDDVIARLKASEELEANEDYQEGLEAGREWARQIATAKELRRIAEYIERCDAGTGNKVNWWDVDHPGWMAPFGATDNFDFKARPSRDGDRDAPDEFWQEALGDLADRVNDADFFHGFGDGAVEVWDQVCDKLQSTPVPLPPSGASRLQPGPRRRRVAERTTA